MHGTFSGWNALHASVCRNQALCPCTAQYVSCGLGVRCFVATGRCGGTVWGVKFLEQILDVLTFDWARVSIWAKTGMASPSISSSTVTSWSVETYLKLTMGIMWNILCCAPSHIRLAVRSCRETRKKRSCARWH